MADDQSLGESSDAYEEGILHPIRFKPVSEVGKHIMPELLDSGERKARGDAA